jgi:uncharacterized protein
VSSAVFKIFCFLSLWLVLWLPVAVPLALRLQWRPFQASTPAQKLPLLLWLYLMAAPALGIVGYWDRPAPPGFAVQPGLFQSSVVSLAVSLAVGLLVGSSSLAILFWSQIRAGWLQQSADQSANQSSGRDSGDTSSDLVQDTPSKSSGGANGWIYVLLLGLALLVGGIEELVFRGFMQQQLQPVAGWWPAAASVSLLFAGLHGLWEGKTVIPQLPGLGLMGLVLTLACQVDQGNLGLAWGLHAGWVWVLASLDTLGFNDYTGKAPLWLTGWNHQPLAGLLGLLFLLSTAAGLLAWRF